MSWALHSFQSLKSLFLLNRCLLNNCCVFSAKENCSFSWLFVEGKREVVEGILIGPGSDVFLLCDFGKIILRH